MPEPRRFDEPPPPLPGFDPLKIPGLLKLGTPVGLLAIGLFFLPIWVWFFWRIEPREGEIATLIRKTGKNLPQGEIIAPDAKHKGIQPEVLSEGRYFRNPYTWSWKISEMTDIPAGKLGVVTRLFGKDLDPGQIVAAPGYKGIVPETLSPGRHRLNPFANRVEIFDAITIRPGHIGVQTALVGADALHGDLPADQRNSFTVAPGVKGVQTKVLDPGTYYLNPYLWSVAEVNLQSQRFELGGDDAISFLTSDGFNVVVEGTLEFSLVRDDAALLTHRVGDMADIVKKIILPRARGFSRIEGSKNPALNYIVGEMRQQFQNNLENHLREQCASWGVAVKSVLIRNITVPDEIASIIRDREVAVQTAKMFEQQIVQARSKAELVKQEMLAEQNKEKVQSETEQLQALILAKQERQVLITGAEQELAVAKVENEAAEALAAAVVAKALGDQEAIRAGNEAEASVLRSQAEAFGSGMNYARHLFYQKVGPKIDRVLSTDQPEGLGGLFQPLLPQNGGNSR
jgi:regulator of protease activity HflC (stomatin/prohibitin superfamily)